MPCPPHTATAICKVLPSATAKTGKIDYLEIRKIHELSISCEFFTADYHERRATGRKTASPGTVVRGSVRLIAATATRLDPLTAQDLGRVDHERWREVRRSLDQRRHARTLQSRFRRNPDAYLTELESQAEQLTLPS